MGGLAIILSLNPNDFVVCQIKNLKTCQITYANFPVLLGSISNLFIFYFFCRDLLLQDLYIVAGTISLQLNGTSVKEAVSHVVLHENYTSNDENDIAFIRVLVKR